MVPRFGCRNVLWFCWVRWVDSLFGKGVFRSGVTGSSSTLKGPEEIRVVFKIALLVYRDCFYEAGRGWRVYSDRDARRALRAPRDDRVSTSRR
jgi:hypothetical protein